MSNHVEYSRTGHLLNRKFVSYLLPTTLTMAALSLNEFVDSMVVSRLLGSDAMAVVNLGVPVVLTLACFYSLLGDGGATLFARALGARKRPYAGTCFRTAILSSAIIGILITLLGLVFLSPLSRLLCRDPVLLPVFERYLRAVLISSPFIMVVLTFSEFLPSFGMPAHATAINIVANCINVLMDIVYIRVFHMGVEGAAYATMTGYAVVLIPTIWAVLCHKIHIPAGKWFNWEILLGIAVTGGPSSLVQLGYALKFGYSNALAATLGGTEGVIAFSLCIQSVSFISIFLMGATSAAEPLIAVLHGQKDYYGETTILKSTIRVTLLSIFILGAIFEVFPWQIADLYNIEEPAELQMAVYALRIFVISFVFRGIYMVIMRYMQAIGKYHFPMFISLFDGCLGIIPISWICTKLFGLEGVWAAYPITGLILLLIVLIHNAIVAKRSNGLLTGIFLTRKDEPTIRSHSWTIPEEKLSWLSETLSEFCIESGISGRISRHAGLVAEEMVLYTLKNTGRSDYMDVIARQYPDRVEIDFRSLGVPVNPLLPFDEDTEDISAFEQNLNLKLLREISDKLDYEYVMGMNCTHAEIKVSSDSKAVPEG